MSMQIKIQHNLNEVPVFLNSVTNKALKKAIKSSIGRTVTGLNTESARFIRQKQLLDLKRIPFNKLKSKYFIRSRVYADINKPVEDMYGDIEFKGMHLSLSYFFPKERALGKRVVYFDKPRDPTQGHFRLVNVSEVTAKIGQRRYVIPNAFISKKNPKGPIFRRVGASNKPIRKLYGPRMSTTIERNQGAAHLQAYAQARYEREFNNNFAFYLSKT